MVLLEYVRCYVYTEVPFPVIQMDNRELQEPVRIASSYVQSPNEYARAIKIN